MLADPERVARCERFRKQDRARVIHRPERLPPVGGEGDAIPLEVLLGGEVSAEELQRLGRIIGERDRPPHQRHRGGYRWVGADGFHRGLRKPHLAYPERHLQRRWPGDQLDRTPEIVEHACVDDLDRDDQ